MNFRNFEISDPVTWTHISRLGRSCTMSVRQGKVVAVDGRKVTVRFRGKNIVIDRMNLRHRDEQSTLGELLSRAQNQ